MNQIYRRKWAIIENYIISLYILCMAPQILFSWDSVVIDYVIMRFDIYNFLEQDFGWTNCHVPAMNIYSLLPIIISRDHSEYELSQWEEALLCNTFSLWLNPYPECSLISLVDRLLDMLTTVQAWMSHCRLNIWFEQISNTNTPRSIHMIKPKEKKHSHVLHDIFCTYDWKLYHKSQTTVQETNG